jgi:hypothetical protein
MRLSHTSSKPRRLTGYTTADAFQTDGTDWSQIAPPSSYRAPSVAKSSRSIHSGQRRPCLDGGVVVSSAPTAGHAATKLKVPCSPSDSVSRMRDSYGHANVAIMG